MWVAAVAIVLPVAIPTLFLLRDVLTAGESAWSTLFSTRTLELLIRSIVFTAAVAASAAIIGVTAAWVTERTTLPGRAAWSIALALPLVIPSYVLALSYISFFGERGLFADLAGIGLPSISGAFGAWLALTISTYPYVYLIVRAAIRRVDPALEEAAQSLGAGSARRIRTVLVPQLRPAIAAGTLLAALYTLSDFGAVSLMRVDVFTRVIYAQYQGRIDRTPAAVLSVVLIVIALVVIWAEQRARGRSVYFSKRPSRPPTRVTLTTRGRRISTTALAVVVGAGVVLPVVVLVLWLLRGLVNGAALVIDWGSVAGSLSGSIAAAAIATAAAIPVVVLTARYPWRGSRWLDRGVVAMFSLPHIAVALGVVTFAAAYLGGAYQTFALLVVVYASIFLAQATTAGESSLLQVNPDLEDAARGLGKSAARTLGEITLPLMRRGLIAGAALVFLTTMKELPATLLLRPTGFDTLAVDIWSRTNDLFFARAAVPALVLLLASSVPMYFFVIRERTG